MAVLPSLRRAAPLVAHARERAARVRAEHICCGSKPADPGCKREHMLEECCVDRDPGSGQISCPALQMHAEPQLGGWISRLLSRFLLELSGVICQGPVQIAALGGEA